MDKVERVTAQQSWTILPDLIALLQDVVNGGASVGFIPPLTNGTAETYWRKVFEEITSGERVLLVSRDSGRVTGSVQLSLCQKQNGMHRAEVQKLLVHTQFRNRGIARGLLREIDAAARDESRSLLVLDTEQDSIAEKLYRKCGYIEAGVIPQYALTAYGGLISTVLFYRLLTLDSDSSSAKAS
jgi:acetyltransferase